MTSPSACATARSFSPICFRQMLRDGFRRFFLRRLPPDRSRISVCSTASKTVAIPLGRHARNGLIAGYDAVVWLSQGRARLSGAVRKKIFSREGDALRRPWQFSAPDEMTQKPKSGKRMGIGRKWSKMLSSASSSAGPHRTATRIPLQD
jgi:hypothetical protein